MPFVFAIIGGILGGFLAYVIQFDWHFFGATMMRFQDIVEVWAGCIGLPAVFGFLIGIHSHD